MLTKGNIPLAELQAFVKMKLDVIYVMEIEENLEELEMVKKWAVEEWFIEISVFLI